MKTKQTMVYGARILLCAFAVMFALAFTACDHPLDGPSGPPGGPPPIPLNGTWSSPDGEKIVLNNGSVAVSQNDVEFARGTYITIGSTIAMTFTQFNGSFLTTSGLDMLTLSPTQWYTQLQLRAAIINYFVVLQGLSLAEAEAAYNEEIAPIMNEIYKTFTGTYSGNTLSITIFGETATYTNPVIGGGPSTGAGNLQNWITVSNSTIPNYAIAYGNGLFVAVGNFGRMVYSSNGVSWTDIDSPYVDQIMTIAYGDGKFVAGDSNGNIAYSSNGIDWTAVASNPWLNTELNAYVSIRAIAYGNGKFVAVGDWGKIAYSSDGGETWTEVLDSTFGGYDEIRSVAFGNGRFVAGGLDKEYEASDYYGDNHRMASSSDGISWTKVPNFRMYSILDIAYGNGVFVAGGVPTSTMAYSTNGTSWTAVPGVRPSCIAIAYGNGRFVSVGSGTIEYSSDGITWTAVANSPLSDLIHAIAYGGGRFVALGYGPSIAYCDW